MVLKVVQDLEQANVEFEAAIRKAVKLGNIALESIEAAASDKTVNQEGYFNINTSEFRLNNAKARLALEEAHNYQTENHLGFNAIADSPDNAIERSDSLTIQPQSGGGR